MYIPTVAEKSTAPGRDRGETFDGTASAFQIVFTRFYICTVMNMSLDSDVYIPWSMSAMNFFQSTLVLCLGSA